jgi:hypothetical protein
MGPQVKPAVSFHVGVTTNHATDVAESSHAMPCHAMPCQYSNCTSDVLLSAIALEFGWLPTHSHIHIRWGVDIGSILGSTKFQVHSGSARLEIEEWNGMEWNGMEWNGMERNGTERNGTERNGTERNGTERNGTERNGTEQTRLEDPIRRVVSTDSFADKKELEQKVQLAFSSVSQGGLMPFDSIRYSR